MPSGCPACGASSPEGVRFCPSCGHEFVRRCPACGNSASETDRFCSSCGQVLDDESVRGPDRFAPQQERKVVTMLFADLTGSTSLGEQLDPEHTSAVVGGFLAAMSEEVDAQGGTIEKYAGDALLAVFGLPSAHEDDPLRAARAALAMRRRVAQFDGADDTPLQVRIGINTGEVLAATELRPDRTMATGDAVNVAARLEQLAEPGQIVVGERTARSLPGARLTAIPPLALRGKAVPVNAYLLDELEEVEARGVPGLHARLVGRDRELAWLVSTLERAAAERRPHLVTVFGEAGVGKSRLTREFLATLESPASATVVLRGRCLPYGEGITYWPLAEMAKTLAGIYETDPGELALKKVRTLSTELFDALGVDTDADSATDAIAFTLGLLDDAAPFAMLPPRRIQVEIHSAWRLFFSALAVDSTVVVVVEDIHWADQELLDLLEHGVERTVGPTMFLCPARPELTSNRPTWGAGKRNWSSLSLSPLTETESTQLVTDLLDVDGLDETTRESILDHAEGNPFYLEEIVRHLIDSGRVVRQGDRWVATSRLPGFEIPDSIHAVLAARLDLLDPAHKRIAQAAAVIGRTLWVDAVAHVSGASPDDVLAAVSELERRELVEERLTSSLAGQREFAFRHILVRDATYASLPRADRAAGHVRAAEWISSVTQEGRANATELLAYHWLLAYESAAQSPTVDASDVERLRRTAWEAVSAARDGAHHRFSLEPAHAFAHRALTLSSEREERAEALYALGAVSSDRLDGDAALATWLQALELVRTTPAAPNELVARICSHAVELCARWSGICSERADEAVAEELYNIGIAATGSAEGEDRVRLLVARAFWPHTYTDSTRISPDFTEEVALAEEAAAIAERLQLYALASAALDAVEATLRGAGRFDEALAVSERRIALIDRTADPWEQADTYAMAACTRTTCGHHREAIPFATEGYERLRSVTPAGAAHSVAWRAVARFHSGDWDGALADQATYEAFLSGRPVPHGVARTWGVAAIVQFARGDAAEGRRLLRLVEELRSKSPSGFTAPYVAWALLTSGDAEAGRSVLAGIQDKRRSLDNRLHVLAASCDVLGELGAWDDAEALLAEARSFSDSVRTRLLPPHIDRLAGRLAAAHRDLSAGRALISGAVDGFAAMGDSWNVALSQLALAESCVTAKESAAAREPAVAALSIFRELGATALMRRVSVIAT